MFEKSIPIDLKFHMGIEFTLIKNGEIILENIFKEKKVMELQMFVETRSFLQIFNKIC